MVRVTVKVTVRVTVTVRVLEIVRVRRVLIPVDINSRFESDSKRGMIIGESQIMSLGVQKKRIRALPLQSS